MKEPVTYPVKITLRDGWPEDPQVGDAWYEEPREDGRDNNAPEHKGKRPLRVQVGPNESFMIYQAASREPHAGWTVTGSVEDGTLTVSPSILIKNPGGAERFHGYIRNGQVTL